MIFKFHLSPHWQSPPPTSTSIAAAHCALHVRVGATNGGCLGQCHLRCAPATLTDISPKYPMIMAAKDSVRVKLQPDLEALTPPLSPGSATGTRTPGSVKLRLDELQVEVANQRPQSEHHDEAATSVSRRAAAVGIHLHHWHSRGNLKAVIMTPPPPWLPQCENNARLPLGLPACTGAQPEALPWSCLRRLSESQSPSELSRTAST